MGTLNTSDGTLWAEQGSTENLDYSLDWSSLASAADPIQSSTWTAAAGVTITNQANTATVTSFWVTGGTPDQWYALTNNVTTQSGRSGSRTIMLFVTASAPVMVGSALFPNRFAAVVKLRKDRLMVAAAGALPSVQVSNEYLWDKLRAAEAAIAHELRVPLVPTAFFPAEPTAYEIAALGGMPWAIDPGYDYKPEDFAWNDKWGMLKLRNKPLQSVSRVRFAYPGGPTAHYDLPLDWVRADNKYGTIQFVPSSTAFAAPLNQFVMQAIGMGRSIPLAIQLTYVAGLKDVKADYPDLIDAVYKMAALKIVEDAFLPQSGSISADGLSQSVSNDMANHSETIDRILHGGKGSNGGLMAAIHGIRIGVM